MITNSLEGREELVDMAMDIIDAENNDHSDVRGVVLRMIAAGYKIPKPPTTQYLKGDPDIRHSKTYINLVYLILGLIVGFIL